MIHEAFSKTEIAVRYYRMRGIELEKEAARKRLFLDVRDGRIEKGNLQKVIGTIIKEQKKLLK